MNQEEQTLWIADISLTVSDVVENDTSGEYDGQWAEDVMHIAQHVAEAEVEVLREAFMMMAAVPGDGPARAHLAIVGATIAVMGEQ